MVALVLKGALVGATFCGTMGGLASIVKGDSFFDGFFVGVVQGALFGAAFGTLGIIGHVFGKAIGTLFEAGKFFNAMHKISLASGISALTMVGFDVASLTAGAFNHDSPLYQFNKELHKSDLYNGLQLGASIVAVFTGAFYKGWKEAI